MITILTGTNTTYLNGVKDYLIKHMGYSLFVREGIFFKKSKDYVCVKDLKETKEISELYAKKEDKDRYNIFIVYIDGGDGEGFTSIRDKKPSEYHLNSITSITHFDTVYKSDEYTAAEIDKAEKIYASEVDRERNKTEKYHIGNEETPTGIKAILISRHIDKLPMFSFTPLIRYKVYHYIRYDFFDGNGNVKDTEGHVDLVFNSNFHFEGDIQEYKNKAYREVEERWVNHEITTKEKDMLYSIIYEKPEITEAEMLENREATMNLAKSIMEEKGFTEDNISESVENYRKQLADEKERLIAEGKSKKDDFNYKVTRRKLEDLTPKEKLVILKKIEILLDFERNYTFKPDQDIV